MILVKKLTETQKDSISGKEFKPFHYFSPIKDINDQWVISKECSESVINEEFLWVKELPEIEFIPQTKTLGQILAEMSNQ